MEGNLLWKFCAKNVVKILFALILISVKTKKKLGSWNLQLFQRIVPITIFAIDPRSR